MFAQEIVGTAVKRLTGHEIGQRPQSEDFVNHRVGDAPVFLSFDIDVIDPCLAPGTGTPEAAGLLPYQALRFVRALAGLPFVGFDVVEVSPQLDGPGGPTAILAANVAYEFLGLNLLGSR